RRNVLPVPGTFSSCGFQAEGGRRTFRKTPWMKAWVGRYNRRGGLFATPLEGNTMPIHDWTRVDANLFHDFHQTWTIAIRNAMNGGLLPKGYSALVEQHAGGLVPDVIALERR